MKFKRLHLLLAPKERFEPAGAGAFALNAMETSRLSRWRPGITVFGSPVASPFKGIRFHALAVSRWSPRDRNVGMARRYVDVVKGDRPDLVEIFNRPIMVEVIKRHLADVPIIVHFGNDPRGMDGSRTGAERRALLARSAAVACVSDYIRRCFLDGLDSPLEQRVHVVHTGVESSAELPAAKGKHIVYVGRVVPEKGVLQLVQALARVLPKHPAWSAEIIGARWFGQSGAASTYERTVSLAATQCERIVLQGFMPHVDVVNALRGASIAVVPSCWDDPFPRTALEALGQGCALVCSARGGIPEIGRQRALFLDCISADSLAEALNRLIVNDAGRLALQRLGWEDFPFDINRTMRRLDDLRAAVMHED